MGRRTVNTNYTLNPIFVSWECRKGIWWICVLTLCWLALQSLDFGSKRRKKGIHNHSYSSSSILNCAWHEEEGQVAKFLRESLYSATSPSLTRTNASSRQTQLLVIYMTEEPGRKQREDSFFLSLFCHTWLLQVITKIYTQVPRDIIF